MDDLFARMDSVTGEPFETTKAFRMLRLYGLAAL
jgi:hypothetical protein